MHILNTISRILVGSLFIVSGLIKANDALGFSYKLNDYFATDVLNMPFLVPFSLAIAVIICIAEIVIGVAALVGAKMRLTAWSLLLMIVFFTFLTFYSAYFNKVTDCGCFGDALKLTPWQSFSKDVVLLVFVSILFVFRNKTELNTSAQDRLILPIATVLVAIFSIGKLGWSFPLVFTILILGVALLLKNFVKSRQIEWILAGWVTLATGFFSYYTLSHLPIKDFRPYAEGKNIQEGMKSAEELGLEAPVYVTDYVVKNKKSGEEKVVNSSEYMNIYQEWDYVEAKGEPYKIKDGYEPPIHDFNIFSEDGTDITYDILNDEALTLFVIAYDINHSDGGVQERLNEVYKAATAQGVKVYGLSASSLEDIQTFKHEHQSLIDYYTCDAIVLKTIVRSNPGIVLLKKGTILKKWHHNDLPTFQEIISDVK